MNHVRLFYQGLSDSLKLTSALTHYTGRPLSVAGVMESVWQPATTPRQHIDKSVWTSVKATLLCIGKLLLTDAADWATGWLIPGWIFAPIKVLLYTDNLLHQTVYIQMIATYACKVETDVLNNGEYFIYQLEGVSNSMIFFEQVNLVIKALLFSIILLLQTVALDVVILVLPQVYLLNWIVAIIACALYSVYISVGLYSLKIPYQDHLPYYFHQNIAYLSGLCFIQSAIVLNYAAFPYLGCIIALLAPFYQLQVMRHDPPFLGQPPIQDTTKGTSINRNSYKYHLYYFNKDATYKQQSENMIGWFSVPKFLRPYFMTLVRPTIKAIQLVMKPIFNMSG